MPQNPTTMQNLMIIALGPIQDFIESARRSRDLWYGSWLLSDLSKTAARTVAARHGFEALIFPRPDVPAQLAPESELGVANKIVAIVPGGPGELTDLANAIEEAVRERLDSLAVGVFDRIDERATEVFGSSEAGLDDRTTARQQVADLLEFYWVAQPLVTTGAGDNYASVRRSMEALLAARKATRNFRQLNGRSGFPKSSLDGMRESVVPKERYPASRDGRSWQNEASRLYYVYGAGPAEQLSGVDLLKRQGSVDKHFFSTSYFAAQPFLKRLDAQKVGPALTDFIKALGDRGVRPDKTSIRKDGAPLGEYDAALLYPARLAESIKGDGEKREITNLLENFLQKVAGAARPQPYYALLHADGDRMGATIDAQDKPEKHQEISEALSRFAAQAEEIVANHAGAAVYTGGDDLLAFLPLHTVLQCAEALAAAFAEALRSFAGADGLSPTLSTGIVVTHHLEPLSDALRLVRDAEKAAKHVKDKHGLAVVVSKRSGVDRTVAGPRLVLAPRLQQLISLHCDGGLPAGAAYQMQDMVVRLGSADAAATALRFETQRILRHKPALRTADKEDNDTQRMLQRLLAQAEVTPAELVNELIIARFFADAQALAEGK